AIGVVRLALSRRFVVYTLSVVATVAFLALSVVHLGFLFVAAIAVIFAAIGTYDVFQTHHSLLRNYPISARIRFLLEEIRPAIRALNKGAKLGGFFHDTGEGGYSAYHKEPGGDIVWELGSGYFGCRNPDGTFSVERFTDQATLDQVKMVEIKLSQGAKPGHGG